MGDPTVLVREAVCEAHIANGAWEWHVNCPADMHVSEFGVSDAELPPAEAMWMNRYMRPSTYLLFELPHLCHGDQTPYCIVSMRGQAGSIQRRAFSEMLTNCDARRPPFRAILIL